MAPDQLIPMQRTSEVDAGIPRAKWFKTVGELECELAAEPKFLVEGIVSTTVTMLAGAPYSGKSSLTDSLGAALVTGEDTWLGRAIEPGEHRVGYVVTDPGAVAEAQERLALLAPEATDRLLIARFNHNDPNQTWLALAAELAEAGADLMIVDNLLGAMPPGCDPSNAEHARAFIQQMDQARDFGLALLVAHHTAKSGLGNSGKSPLGSQLWRAWPQASILLQKSSETIRRLEIETNVGMSTSMTLTMSYGTGAPLFTVTTNESRKSERGTERMDRYQDAANWIVTVHPMVKRKSELAKLLAEEFGGAASTWEKDLGPKYILGGMLTCVEGVGWSLR
ncbi:MAG: AAA family ATPase [Actinomycetales bacterium]